MLAKSKPLPLPEAKNENANEGSEDKGADEGMTFPSAGSIYLNNTNKYGLNCVENEENGQDDESTRKKALDQQERLQEAMAQEQQEARPLAQQQSTQDRPLLVDDDRELYTMTEVTSRNMAWDRKGCANVLMCYGLIMDSFYTDS